MFSGKFFSVTQVKFGLYFAVHITCSRNVQLEKHLPCFLNVFLSYWNYALLIDIYKKKACL